MQLLYFITTVTSQVHAARYYQRAGYERLVIESRAHIIGKKVIIKSMANR